MRGKTQFQKKKKVEHKSCTLRVGETATKSFFIRYISVKLNIEKEEAETMFNNISGEYLERIRIGLTDNIPGYKVTQKIVIKNGK